MSDEPFKVLGTARSYGELHAAFRALADERRLTRQTIDAAAGFPSGYASKLLSTTQMKAFGRSSLGPLLAVLGAKIVLVEDPETKARITDSLDKRERPNPVLRPGEHGTATLPTPAAMRKEALRDALRIAGRKGAKIGNAARMVKLTPAQRSRIARQAARARWQKAKRQAA